MKILNKSKIKRHVFQKTHLMICQTFLHIGGFGIISNHAAMFMRDVHTTITQRRISAGITRFCRALWVTLLCENACMLPKINVEEHHAMINQNK